MSAMRALWVGVAGAFGALARYGLSAWVARSNDGAFPIGTLIINVTGSFVLGLLFVLFTERFTTAPTLRAALTIGFLGAYTTFSTFSLETLRLIQDGAVGLAALNVAASVGAGLSAVWLGTVIARTL